MNIQYFQRRKNQFDTASGADEPATGINTTDDNNNNTKETESLLPVPTAMKSEEIREDGSAELLAREISETHNSCITQNHVKPPLDTNDGRMVVNNINIQSDTPNVTLQMYTDRAQNNAQHVSQNNERIELKGKSKFDAGICLNQPIDSHESHADTSV